MQPFNILKVAPIWPWTGSQRCSQLPVTKLVTATNCSESGDPHDDGDQALLSKAGRTGVPSRGTLPYQGSHRI